MTIRWRTVNLPFSSKLRQDADPTLLTDGFVTVLNGSYHKSGAIEKRNGYTLLASDIVEGGSGGSYDPNEPQALAPLNGRPLSVTANGCICEYSDIWDTLTERAQIAEGQLRFSQTGEDSSVEDDFISADVIQIDATDATKAVEIRAFIRKDGASNTDLFARVLSRDGALLWEDRIVYGATSTNPTKVRVVARAGGLGWAFVFYSDDAGDLRAAAIIVGSSGVSVVPPANVRTGVAAYWDVYRFNAATSSDEVVIASSTGASSTIYIDKWGVSGATAITSYSAAGNVNGLSIAYEDDNGLIWTIESDATGLVTARTRNASGAQQSSRTLGAGGSGGIAKSVGFAYDETTVFGMFVWLDSTGTIMRFEADTLALSASYTRRDMFGWRPASHVFEPGQYQPGDFSLWGYGRAYMWIESTEDRVGFVCIELAPEGARPLPGTRPSPVAVLSPDVYKNGTAHLTRPWPLAAGDEERHNQLGVVAALPRAWDDAYTFSEHWFTDPSLYRSAEYNSSAYFASGVVCGYDGLQAFESAYVQRPHIESLTSSVGGAMTGSGVYKYQHTFAWTDASGRIHRSRLAQEETITLGASDGTVTVDLMPLNVTMRQLLTSLPAGRVRYEVWRTTAGGSIFYLLSDEAYTSNTGAAVAVVSITDTNADSAITGNQQLYTTGGEGEHDPVFGGASAIAEHKGRLWAAGGAEGDLIWYSDEAAVGDAANFNVFRQIRIPGHRVTALASLDDAMIAFTERSIFAIFGDGPASNNDPATGSFSVPMPIASDTGCTDPNSVVRGRDGVYFRGRQGFYRLSRSRQVEYVSEPIEPTTQAYPYTHGSTFVSQRGEIRWLVSDEYAKRPNRQAYRVLMLDVDSGNWAVWQHLGDNNDQQIVDIRSVGGDYYILSSDTDFTDKAQLSQEDSSAVVDNLGLGSSPKRYIDLEIETGGVSFGDWQGQKRVRRVRIVYDRGGSDTLKLEHARDANPYEETHTWTDLSASAARAHIKRQKGSRYRWRVTSVEPVSSVDDSGPLVISGLSFEIGSEGNLVRQPTGQSD